MFGNEHDGIKSTNSSASKYFENQNSYTNNSNKENPGLSYEIKKPAFIESNFPNNVFNQGITDEEN
jgi:hypothetical protein